MLDMRLVTLFFDKLVDIFRVIAFIGTEVLFGIGALYHDLDHEIICRPFVMLVSSRDVDR